MARHLFLALSFIFLFSNLSKGQATISGTVIADDSGKPLPGVNVYLSGTSIGSSTDKTGEFHIETDETGNFNLVLSFVGFKKQVIPIKITTSTSLEKNIRLEERVTEMQEVEVKTSNRTWKHRYEIFSEQFLGKTELADHATIENPWVLNFKENGNMLIATAKQPLKITNRALGYKMHVELVMFKWPKYKDQGGAYKIYPKFELMKPASTSQEVEWKEARIRSYKGSYQHFLKSIYEDKISSNGFTIKNSYYLNSLSEGKIEYELNHRPGLAQNLKNNLKGFELEQILEVEYSSFIDFQIDGKEESIRVEKETGIGPNTKSGYFFVTEKGALLNPLSVKTYGDWARERVANRVPLNFSVK